MSTQFKQLHERFEAALLRRSASGKPSQESKFKVNAFRGYLAVVAILGFGLSLAAGEGPDPHPGPSQSVREQNLDAGGFIRVHEQGTANVNVTNLPLPVTGTVQLGNTSLDVNVEGGNINANITGGSVEATVPPATTAYWNLFVVSPNVIQTAGFPTINASAIHASSGNDTVTAVYFKSPLLTLGLGEGLVSLGSFSSAALGKAEVITFSQPVPLNGVEVLCLNPNDDCRVVVSVVGVPAP